MSRYQNEFNFTFDGQIDAIEVSSLTSSLLGLNALIKEVNIAAGTNKKVDLTVKTYKPGSFDVYLQLVADGIAVGQVAGLFSSDNMEAAKRVIELTISSLNLKKFLKSEKPKEVVEMEDSKYKVIDNQGNVFIADNITFNIVSENEKADKIITNMFKPIKDVDGVSGVSIKDHENKVAFETKKGTKGFDYMIDQSPIIKSEEKKTRDLKVPDATLAVYGIVFDDNRKWEFYYKGNKIPVQLVDADFLDKVMDRTYHFANGDRINCELIIHQTWNKTAMVFENKGYTISKVSGPPVPPNPQSNIGFDDNDVS